ncbi:protein PHYTOCHROME KINASE SUBSTRATE 4-like [Canna indica]|uniref:Protein PHYTOCHROME KINASE SUBSTRATE 4-like n=1 Tax=Canna indica TaxID=4628 RepID=A0AAQ3K9V4_9LILI|nr:protein PHYTOCHROME KINASE SUBSTRATE 4-like [Canna indica]
MEKRSMTTSLNGGFYQTPNSFHATHSFISLPPKPHLDVPHAAPQLRSDGFRNHRIARRAADTELNIFEAERYFSEENDAVKSGVDDKRSDLSSDPRASSVSSVDGFGRKSGSLQATPTASSEASWNSKYGLLSNPPRSAAVSLRAFPPRDTRKPLPSAARRFFSRSCPCTGKKSVDVEERHSEPKSPIRSLRESKSPLNAKRQSLRAAEVVLSSIPERAAAEDFKNEFNVEELTKVKITPGSWGKDGIFFNVATRFSPEKSFPAEFGHRIVNSGRSFSDTTGFSFPILSSSSSNLTEEPPRESLEVFRPTEESTKIMRKSSDFQRRSTVLPHPGEGEQPTFCYPASPKPRLDEDAASDASSDLFEIESLSTLMTYRRRDSLDELEGRRFVGSGAASDILQLRRSLEEKAPPSIAPSECYPPSEVSIAWSVTTAEGFANAANFSSAASNYDEFRFVEEEHEPLEAAMDSASGGVRRKANGILSCRCEKAVSVAPNPVRIGHHAVVGEDGQSRKC